MNRNKNNNNNNNDTSIGLGKWRFFHCFSFVSLSNKNSLHFSIPIFRWHCSIIIIVDNCYGTVSKSFWMHLNAKYDGMQLNILPKSFTWTLANVVMSVFALSLSVSLSQSALSFYTKHIIHHLIMINENENIPHRLKSPDLNVFRIRCGFS